MSTFTRKQRDLAHREKLVLETARRILLESGYAGLTMERVADGAEYSKGTIYNHFPTKETMVVEIAARILHGKALYLERAAASKAPSRNRLAALGEATALFLRLYPEDLHIMQILQTQLFMRQITVEQREHVHAQERRACQAVFRVVQDALAQGDLPSSFSAGDAGVLAFSVCSALDGAQSAVGRALPLEDLGVSDPCAHVGRMLDLLADGAGWRALSLEKDYNLVRAHIRESLFEHEVRRLQRAAPAHVPQSA